MRYPSMGSNKRNAVSVPALSGGVNLNDALNLVDDNQMTDCKNVWYKDGILQTRPGIRNLKEFDEQEELQNEKLEMYSTNITGYVDGKKYTFVVKKKKTYSLNLSGEEEVDQMVTEILLLGENGKEKNVSVDGFKIWNYEAFYSGKPTKANGIGLYMMVSRIFKVTLNGIAVTERKIVELYELTENDEFEKLTDDEYYSPLILINGKGDSYSTLPAATETKYAPASMFEGYSEFYNVWHRFCFTTDGVSTGFTIPRELRFCELKVQYTNQATATTYMSDTLKMYNNPLGSISGRLGANYSVTIYPYSNVVEILPDEGKAVLPSSLNALANNIVIYVKWFLPTESQIIDEENYPFYVNEITVSDSKIYGATKSAAFGGSVNGIYGGTRTFLSGIKDTNNRHMIAWSDLNNPTYFPENNYAYIGEETQPITALAKQNDMLVIFKSNELFYTTYMEGETYTAEDVLAGKIVDVTTTSAKFPMVQIHSEIGCDLPNTIQLCGDRLVWACKDKHVYTLRAANQYSITNISKLSAMINKKLAGIADEDINTGIACVYDGNYLLKFGKAIFVLNYDYYYFNALPSYADTKKSQRKLIWYYWEFPQGNSPIFSMFFSNKNRCYIFCANNFLPSSGGVEFVQYNLFELVEGRKQDDCLKQIGSINSGDHVELECVSLPIESVIQTKMFDFGAMERFKSIEQLYIGFGKNEGTVSVEYLTDRGTVDRGSFDLIDTAEENSPQFIKTKRFLPGIKRALRFGIRLTSKGRIAVDGILIKYKYLGVTR